MALLNKQNWRCNTAHKYTGRAAAATTPHGNVLSEYEAAAVLVAGTDRSMQEDAGAQVSEWQSSR
ncbi:Nn.00g018640.m01.CDS01 [Neocucurbitaria sp. VM-36]